MAETSPAVGAQAPDFTAPDEHNRPWRLSEALTEAAQVLVFYRGDWWPYCNGQLVSYARKYTEFQNRGVEITAICVDTPEQNRAMIVKLLLPFRILSDPEGEQAIKPYGVWNEQGRIAIPAVVAVARDRTIRYRYTGQDFADRPGDEELLQPLSEGWRMARGDPPMSLEALVPYYNGAYFATVALKGRLGQLGPEARPAVQEVTQYQQMVTEFRDAIQKTIELKRER